MDGLARIQLRRRQRHHQVPRLNLVSLMDIFTILVLFLLVSSSSDPDLLPHAPDIQLPRSVAEHMPDAVPVIEVSDQEIRLGGQVVAQVADVSTGDAYLIAPLKAGLDGLAGGAVADAAADDEPIRREVVIMGDREIPFDLLKRVLYTCGQTRFSRISMAVVQAKAS